MHLNTNKNYSIIESEYSKTIIFKLFVPVLILYPFIIFFETKYYNIFISISPFKQKISAHSIISFSIFIISILSIFLSLEKNKKKKLLFYFTIIVFFYSCVSIINEVSITRVLNFLILYSTPFFFFYAINTLTNQKNLDYIIKIFLYSFIISGILGLFTIENFQDLIYRTKYSSRWAGIFYSNMIGGYYFGIYALIFLSLYKIKKQKIIFVLFLISTLFSFFSQTRMYTLTLILSIYVIYSKNYKNLIYLIFSLIFVTIIVYITNFRYSLSNLPLAGESFNTFFELIDFLSLGGNFFELSKINTTGYNTFLTLNTLSDRTYFTMALIENLNTFFGNGLASSTSFLQKLFFNELDISHSDPVTLLYEFGLPILILYYIFFIKYIWPEKKINGIMFNILLSFILFDFLSGLTSSNLHLAIPRIIMFWGLCIIQKYFEFNYKESL